MAASLLVEVCNLSGESLEIIVDPRSSTIRNVKVIVAERWQIPPLCQQLVLDNCVLNDDKLLVECFPNGVTISLSLVTSHVRALAALDSDNRDARLDALSALMSTPTFQDESVVAVSKLLIDPSNSQDLELKYGALKALECLAKKGDPHAIAGASSCLESNWRVTHRAHLKTFRSLTRLALGTLSVLAPQGNDVAMRAIYAVLENRNLDAQLRCASLKLLLQISNHGDAHAAKVASEFVQDRDAVVRQAAVKAFTGLAPRSHAVGDTCAIDAVSALLTHRNEDVRCSAVKALTQVVKKCDPHVIELVGRHLGHRDAGVRQTAVQALIALSSQGDESVMAALRVHLDNGDAGVRQTALWGLSQLAALGDEQAILAACKHLEYPDAGVRRTALTTLTKLAAEESGCAMTELGNHLEHQEAAVRQVAVKALFHVAPRANENAAGFFRTCLADVDGEVREAVLEGLPKYFSSDPQTLLEEIRPLLDDTDVDVRRTAVWIYSELSENQDR